MTSSMTRSAAKVSGAASSRPDHNDWEQLKTAPYGEYVTLMRQWFVRHSEMETWVSHDGMVTIHYSGKAKGYILSDFHIHRGFSAPTEKLALFKWVNYINKKAK